MDTDTPQPCCLFAQRRPAGPPLQPHGGTHAPNPCSRLACPCVLRAPARAAATRPASWPRSARWWPQAAKCWWSRQARWTIHDGLARARAGAAACVPAAHTCLLHSRAAFVGVIPPSRATACPPARLPACRPAGRGAGGLLPGGQQQPEAFEGARVVEAGSFPCPGYSSVPLSLGLSPRIYSAVRCGPHHHGIIMGISRRGLALPSGLGKVQCPKGMLASASLPRAQLDLPTAPALLPAAAAGSQT